VAKVQKHRAAGTFGTNASAGNKGIDAILHDKVPLTPQRMGYGRLITTVGTMEDIKACLKDGYHILWCQMSKTMPVDPIGENDG
jgi:hypothetical protein